MQRVKKNNYSFDKDILSIRTESGEYKFKIDGDTGPETARPDCQSHGQ